jgi:hypothetical protein
VRVQDNDLYFTGAGIGSILDVDLELRGNDVEDAQRTGITVILSVHELTLANDRTLRCGYRPAGFSPTPAIGIEILLAIGIVTVDNCRVIDTGESASAAAPVFTAPRHGILVLWAIGARVRGCEIASKPLVPPASGGPSGLNTASRALRMWTFTPAVVVALLQAVGRPMIPFADATDNVIEQSLEVLVEIFAFGEIMFATNRCLNFAGGKLPAAVLISSSTTITGNRVQANTTIPALAAVFNTALSAVGNMTTAGAIILPTTGTAVQMPAPYASFNVAT